MRKKGVATGDANSLLNLNHYFHLHVCASMLLLLSFVRHKKFFSLKSPWNHPLTLGVDPGSVSYTHLTLPTIYSV